MWYMEIYYGSHRKHHIQSKLPPSSLSTSPSWLLVEGKQRRRPKRKKKPRKRKKRSVFLRVVNRSVVGQTFLTLNQNQPDRVCRVISEASQKGQERYRGVGEVRKADQNLINGWNWWNIKIDVSWEDQRLSGRKCVFGCPKLEFAMVKAQICWWNIIFLICTIVESWIM